MKKSYILAVLGIIALLVVAGTLSGCNKKADEEMETEVVTEPEPALEEPEAEPEPVVPEGATIEIEKFDVTGGDVSFEAGATITWKNNGDLEHIILVKDSERQTVTKSDRVGKDQEFSYTFEDAGEYVWLSSAYAGIVTGTVTVE